MVEYHIKMLPHFQDILDESCDRGKYGGWLRVRINLVKRPVIFLGQDVSILKHYFFTKNMWIHKGKLRIVPKGEGCCIVILAFQSQVFGVRYSLTVPYIQTFHEYHALHPKYVHTDASTTILGHIHK